MKKYITNLLMVSFLFFVLLALLSFGRVKVIQNHSWKLNDNIHVLFLGASHINNAIDDSMMKTGTNWSRASERYMYTYIKLKHLIPENPQIDTVFLELAPTDLWEDADNKYYSMNEQSGYVNAYWPFFESENWGVVMKKPSQVLGLVVRSLMEFKDFNQQKWWKSLGGYNKTNETMNRDEVKKDLAVNTGCGNNINYKYLRKIISLCNDDGVKLIFLETPTFHPEYYYNIEYYYNSYLNNFSDVELVDYSNWSMDDDERGDAHHLNHLGAQRFTREIMNRYNIK